MDAAPPPTSPTGRAAGRYDDPDALEARARAALASDRVTAATRRSYGERLASPPAAPQALDARGREALAAVAARLMPLGALGDRIDLTGRADALLARGPGDGWRYADMPPDREAWAAGLAALDASAHAAHGCEFAGLASPDQDALLARVQGGDPPGPAWPLPPARWFEEVLAALTELAYGDLRLLTAIGYDGFADAQGWQGAPLVAPEAAHP